eukprot:15485755-Alexandrium_andersonii.AAC.1
MLGSDAEISSGEPIWKLSLGSAAGFPRTLSTRLKTSRTLAISGNNSRTTLRIRDSECPGTFAKRATTHRRGSRNSSS